MGLGEDSKSGRGAFSKDVLVIEICGPNQEHFSVIDIPGIFRFSNPPFTTDADQEMVREMVRRYIQNSRSIILAVVPANVDPYTQEILKMTTEVDPEGERTLGVLTKPDLVDKGSEDKVVNLVNGKISTRNLGWCVVRNLSQVQLQKKGVDRNKLEMEFFKGQHPWNCLDEDKVGIAALREKLQDMLSKKIRQEFPKVRICYYYCI